MDLADSIEKVDSCEEEVTALNAEYDERYTDLMAQRNAIDEEVRKTNAAYRMSRSEIHKKHGVKDDIAATYSGLYRLLGVGERTVAKMTFA